MGRKGRIAIIVNGEQQILSEALTLQQLLAQRNVTAAHAAVELNGAIIARAMWAKVQLQEKDVVEIVTFVGGG